MGNKTFYGVGLNLDEDLVMFDRKTRKDWQKSQAYVVMSFSKSSVVNVFCLHFRNKPTFLDSFSLKSVYEKPYFRDGLV